MLFKRLFYYAMAETVCGRGPFSWSLPLTRPTPPTLGKNTDQTEILRRRRRTGGASRKKERNSAASGSKPRRAPCRARNWTSFGF